MSIDELVADVLTNYAVAWQSSDGAKCFGIAMELFNLIEQHVEAEMAWRDAEIERLRKTLDEIAMYWNGSHSPTATLDAAEWTRDVAEKALAATKARPATPDGLPTYDKEKALEWVAQLRDGNKEPKP